MLLINKMPAYMPIDEMLINIWFLSSVSVVGYAPYSTIIMVDFKQKIGRVKVVIPIDKAAKFRIEIKPHIKVDIGQ